MGPVVSVTIKAVSVVASTPGLIVFGLCLVAAVTIYSAYNVWVRVNEWERAKDNDKNKKEELRDTMASFGEVPYHASIQLKNKHLCSGTLFHEKHVLTTAVCVAEFADDSETQSKMKVFAGMHAVPDFGTSVGVDRIKIHPLYCMRFYSANVAVVRLKSRIVESPSVRIIALPRRGTTVNEKLELIVSGYSSHAKGIPPGRTLSLHKSKMKVIDGSSCLELYGSSYDMNGKFCAVPSPRYPNCKGDNGGTATVNDLYIMGIYIQCYWRGCDRNYPEFFTLVSPYLDFIKSAMA